ncbi:hypothetical protein CERZMDRAFT_96135 [Cercospora zeae-maydis SCOH1-5]|uniref:Uncharacterized protein n=1 Tax=Cercospora zeae-maydis SCOH1-5 TaxID=717836 RepID=A0A6A6FKY2_9PEZI|nr:hypothetical protein CERZMDRAFT_96135 [Cercospora zeae-maydis SCOH1-5]
MRSKAINMPKANCLRILKRMWLFLRDRDFNNVLAKPGPGFPLEEPLSNGKEYHSGKYRAAVVEVRRRDRSTTMATDTSTARAGTRLTESTFSRSAIDADEVDGTHTYASIWGKAPSLADHQIFNAGQTMAAALCNVEEEKRILYRHGSDGAR